LTFLSQKPIPTLKPDLWSLVQVTSGYRLATADDYDARDPVSWIVFGSTDCVSFTTLDIENDYYTPFARNSYLPAFWLPTAPPTVSPTRAPTACRF
jgi:hypothetical protein